MARPATLGKSLPSLGQFFVRFWPILRAESGLLASGFLALLAQTLFRLLEPWPLKFVIDEVINPEVSSGVQLPGIGAVDSSAVIILAALSLVAITGLRSTLGYRSKVNFAVAGNRTLTRIRSLLFCHLQHLSLAFHQRERGGDLVTRVVGDVGMLKEVTVNAVMPLVASVLVLTGMIGVMLFLNVTLTLIVLALAPLLWLVTSRRSKQITRVARKNRRREGAIAATASESLTAIKTVQALSAHDNFERRFTAHNNASMRQGAKVAKMSAALERSVDLMIAVATAVALWFGANLVMTSALSPGELLVFLFYFKRGFRPMRDYAKYSARLAKAAAAAERVTEILDQVPLEQDVEHVVEAPNFRGEIEFDDVSFAYDDGTIGLRNASLTIAPGETAMIMGPSGSGKTTLLNLLTRLYLPQSGTIRIDGHPISDFSTRSYRAQFGMVLQDGMLFSATVNENIALLQPDASAEEIMAAARLACADEFIERLPDGFDTLLGERGLSLSRGQRQRIAVARAAICPAPVLVLDEPTTGLDAANETAVMEGVAKLASRSTTILVTHRYPRNLKVDRLFLMRDGLLIEQTDRNYSLADEGAFRQLFESEPTLPISPARAGSHA